MGIRGGKRGAEAVIIGTWATDGDHSETRANADDDDVTYSGSEDETTRVMGMVSKCTGT